MYARIMAMRAGIGVDPTPGFSAPLTCPLYHGPASSMWMPAHALAAAPAGVGTEAIRTVAFFSELSPRLSGPSLAHAGRGPPASHLS